MAEENKKILIVEDDKNFLWVLKESFNNVKELSVFVAEDGEEGLKIAKKENPDLALIDIMLPKMDGITMAKNIKEEGIKTKMIFLTNLKDLKHVSEAMNVMPEIDYIVKSDVKVDDVVERVKDKLGI